MWPAAVQAHFDARLPFQQYWGIWAQVKQFDTNVVVSKALWSGDYDYTITLDNVTRTYEGAVGGLKIAAPRFRVGTYIMNQEIGLALSPEGKSIVQDYNTFRAPGDIWCFVFDSRNRNYLGARRYFKGFIESAKISEGAKRGRDDVPVDVMSLRMASIARKGMMAMNNKKSKESQKERLATDTFRKYSDKGTVQNDPWGATDDD